MHDVESLTLMYDVDYLALMSKPRTSPEAEISRSLKRMAGEHYWYDHTHFSMCREHLLNDYYAGIERRNRLSERVSKLHNAYRKKKRSW